MGEGRRAVLLLTNEIHKKGERSALTGDEPGLLCAVIVNVSAAFVIKLEER